jgi:hypothetical protein
MVGGSAGLCRNDAVEPEVVEIKRLDEHVNCANRIAIVDPVIEAFRQQRRLLVIHPMNEARCQFPHRFSKGIIASMGFSTQSRSFSTDSRCPRMVRLSPEQLPEWCAAAICRSVPCVDGSVLARTFFTSQV